VVGQLSARWGEVGLLCCFREAGQCCWVAFLISAFFILPGIYPASYRYPSTWIPKQVLPPQQLPSMLSLTLSCRVAVYILAHTFATFFSE